MDELEKQYREALNSIINLREIKKRAEDKYNKVIDFLKRRKEIIDNKGNKVVFKDMGTAVEFIDCTNGVNLAVILGEILGKTRDEVIKDIGLKSYNDTFRYF